jgi:hypothetical protein
MLYFTMHQPQCKSQSAALTCETGAVFSNEAAAGKNHQKDVRMVDDLWQALGENLAQIARL